MKLDLKNWSLLRVLRLVFGFTFLANIPYSGQPWLFGLAGGLFLYQGIANTGCQTGNCATGKQQPTINSLENPE